MTRLIGVPPTRPGRFFVLNFFDWKDFVARLLWWFLAERLEAKITDRLLAYHEGLVERGQVLPPLPSSNIPVPRPRPTLVKSPSDGGWMA